MWSQCNLKSRWPVFKVGDNVLLSIQKVALHHPSLRKKFTPRWIGPCEILEIVGRAAARIRLPSTLQSLGMHDVFHFSVLKQYDQSFALQAEPDPTPKPPAAATFEVECIKDYSKSRKRQDSPVHAPHFLVAWRGYDASHDLWLPVDELGNCLEAVADFLFVNTSPKQRDKILNQFPRTQRQQLAHLIARAFKSRRPARDQPTVKINPPRTRAPRRKKRSAAVALSSGSIPTCLSCTQNVQPITLRTSILDAMAPDCTRQQSLGWNDPLRW